MTPGQSFARSSVFTVALMRRLVRKRGQAKSIVTTGNRFRCFETRVLTTASNSRGNYQLAYLMVSRFVAGGALCLALLRRPAWIATAASSSKRS